MNTDTATKRAKLNRSLAVTGFILVIILLAWLAIQIVRYAPSGFTSLASLAQGLTQYRESLVGGDLDSPLIVQSNVASSTAGTPIVLTWEKDGRLGRYAFSHACRDGLTVELVDTEGLRSLSCGTRYDLGDIETITIIADSTTEPVVELPYIISFTRTNDTEPVRAGENIVTVVNDDVIVATNDDNGTVLGETDSTDTEETPTAPAPKPTPVVTKPEYTYTLPTSDPNGYIDLKTTFIATGDITGRTFKAGSIKQNTDGAIQFSIQNSGTKTPGKWTYTVLLPDSDTYTSPLQAPLLPTERAIISIGFPVDDSTSHTFVVVVAEASDSNLKNNSFKQVTRFLK